MSESRQVRRAQARKAKKATKIQSQQTTRDKMAILTKALIDLQVGMNALYQVLIDKGLFTEAEFKASRAKFLETTVKTKPPETIVKAKPEEVPA